MAAYFRFGVGPLRFSYRLSPTQAQKRAPVRQHAIRPRSPVSSLARCFGAKQGNPLISDSVSEAQSLTDAAVVLDHALDLARRRQAVRVSRSAGCASSGEQNKQRRCG